LAFTTACTAIQAVLFCFESLCHLFIAAASEYVMWIVQIHQKGLKLGIYGDFGTNTCMGYPGNEYYLEYDAETYANWTVDYLKLDGCNSDISQYDDGNLLQLFFVHYCFYCCQIQDWLISFFLLLESCLYFALFP